MVFSYLPEAAAKQNLFLDFASCVFVSLPLSFLTLFCFGFWFAYVDQVFPVVASVIDDLALWSHHMLVFMDRWILCWMRDDGEAGLLDFTVSLVSFEFSLVQNFVSARRDNSDIWTSKSSCFYVCSQSGADVELMPQALCVCSSERPLPLIV